MNQIIDNLDKNIKAENLNNNDKKFKNQNYKIIFIIFSTTSLIFLMILLAKIYSDNKNEEIAQKLTKSYSISTLYANTTNYAPQVQSSEPFVIGIIKIDKINLNYSILSISNNDLLDISVCRFAGPMPNQVGNLCIAGHNYVDYKFFSRLNELEINDQITIYDLNGNSLNYSIYDIYEATYNDTSCTFQNTNNMKLVTLVTCNNVNGKRLVVHAKAI